MLAGQEEYYLDAKENLEALETALFKHDEEVRAANVNNSLIHVMFRFAHNTKGALASVNEETAVSVLHHAESALDDLRNKVRKPTVELASALLDNVAGLLTWLEDGDLQALEGLTEKILNLSDSNQANEETSENSGNIPGSKKDLLERCSSGEKLYKLEKLIRTSTSFEELTSLPVFEDIKNIGEVLSIIPELNNIPKDFPECAIEIYFKSKLTSDELSYQIFDVFEEITAGKNQNSEKCLDTATNLKAFKILICEDDVVSRKIISTLMAPYGITDIAVDGREGLILWHLAQEDKEPYDLIILDIMMPVLDGRTLLRNIRKSEEERNLDLEHSSKIIMTTAMDDPRSVLGSFKEGCEGYIVKPVIRKKLTELLQKLGIASL